LGRAFRLYPVLIDDRPPYLAGREDLSLLLMPVGSRRVLDLLRGELAEPTRNRVTVVTPFRPLPAYCAALAAAGIRSEDVLEATQFAARLHEYEPSDWLLLRDSRFVSAEPLTLTELLQDIPRSHRAARHLVALAATLAGTSERVLLDPQGRVARIQRYYEGVTWPFASGVALSAVPVAGTLAVSNPPMSSLAALRSCLTAQGVPARDFFVEQRVFDLAHEVGILGLAEARLRAEERAGRGQTLAATVVVEPTAQLRGPVWADEEVAVGERALVIGPAVLGRGSRVGSGAVVVQCVVAPGATVPPSAVARHQVVSSQNEGLRPARETPYRMPAEGLHVSDEERRDVVSLKRAFDFTSALVGLVILSPLLAVFAAIIRLDSRGPVLFGDRREGRGGRAFRCWKFRTMHEGAEIRQDELSSRNQVDGPQFKMREDPRVTRVGRWMRRLDFDELPQLLNVLAGSMSLVGPRPSPFRENQICVPWREARLSVHPGITGLWQVCRHDRADGDFHQWIYYDLLYVQHMSFWLDLKILVATLLTRGGRQAASLPWLLPPHKFHERRAAERSLLKLDSPRGWRRPPSILRNALRTVREKASSRWTSSLVGRRSIASPTSCDVLPVIPSRTRPAGVDARRPRGPSVPP
jgi:lipopolysaccharide/colanic/teichoic acid biosynthesis glycosyltransferase